MKNKYIDLIEQTYEWPQEEFRTEDGELLFHDINMMDIIKQYGTPLKFTYLPKISENIKRAKMMFNVAMAKVDYQGNYNYCYCTKSSHFIHVMEEALKNDINIETSSAFDIDLIRSLYEKDLIKKDKFIICNGFKMPQYIENIAELIKDGFTNVIPIVDNFIEADKIIESVEGNLNLGIRIASEEDPKFPFYTSRLGIGYKDILPFFKEKIRPHKNVKLKMLHFFINTGIADTAYYWNELHKCLKVYCDLKRFEPNLTCLNIGGGFPIKNSLAFEYDYEYMASEIIAQVKMVCESQGIPEPDIFTEFGSFTVGESGGVIYKIQGQKIQNDREKWNMIDSSFMTTLPDSWAINRKFIQMPINRWNDTYERVLLGGLTCDSDDYYDSEQHTNTIYLPVFKKDDPLYVGFFHTGAYQDSIGGYGGIQHCLTPAPKQIIISKDSDGEYSTKLFSKEQSYKSMLKLLGY